MADNSKENEPNNGSVKEANNDGSDKEATTIEIEGQAGTFLINVSNDESTAKKSQYVPCKFVRPIVIPVLRRAPPQPVVIDGASGDSGAVAGSDPPLGKPKKARFATSDEPLFSHGSFTRSDTDPDIRREDPVWQYFVHRFATVQCPATVICCLCDNDEHLATANCKEVVNLMLHLRDHHMTTYMKVVGEQRYIREKKVKKFVGLIKSTNEEIKKRLDDHEDKFAELSDEMHSLHMKTRRLLEESLEDISQYVDAITKLVETPDF